ncbi:hypothetical protein [Undibacterium sp. Tian12W]|uniref:hypothetical protein n=1 Tax=Undibacterium sp. Tian12W TaxID=3413054 RepID=UPI003BF11033
MNVLIEFEVDSVELNLDEQTLMVDGKLYRGPIKTGDSINAIYVLTWSDFDGKQPSASKIVSLQKVSLSISRIFSFRRYLNELSQGHTATIQINGEIDDLKKIQAGMCIGFVD